jgi:3-(3-hydroxy-phenyl)propionate hydroxylase
MMIGLALGMGWAMTAGGRIGNAARRFIAPRLRLVPGLREKLVNGTTPALHRSALVVRGRRPRQLAGTLCPNPVLAEGESLDAVFGNHFALVTTTWPTASQCELLEEHGAVIHVVQPGSELAQWLRRGHATAAIIRPDRTVMAAGRNLSRLCAAMPAFTPAVRSTQVSPAT